MLKMRLKRPLSKKGFEKQTGLEVKHLMGCSNCAVSVQVIHEVAVRYARALTSNAQLIQTVYALLVAKLWSSTNEPANLLPDPESA